MKQKKYYFLESNEKSLIFASYEYPNYASMGFTSCTGAYSSEEELKKELKILDDPCIYCGRIVRTHYLNGERLREKNICFYCDFWEGKIKEIHNPNVVRINNCHYTIGSEKDPKDFRGFGGKTFEILTSDGIIIKTSNLWYQGEIPEYFRTKLPNNAIFLK